MANSRNNNKYYIMLLVTVIGLLFSNVADIFAAKIKPVVFSGFSEITIGDTAIIHWQFENADRVRIEGFDGVFKSVDTVRVSPEFTRSYSITAYQDRTSIFGSDDSLIAGWRVYVKPSEGNVTSIQTGLKPIRAGEGIPSNYFTYMNNAETAYYPTKIKVLRTDFTDETRSECTISALLMDESGRYIPGLTEYSDNIHLSAIQYCSNGKLEAAGTNLFESVYNPQTQNHIAIILENSSAAADYTAIWESVRSYLAAPGKNDIYSISYFNHKLHDLISLSSAEIAAKAIVDTDIEAPSGLTGIYKAAFRTINKLSDAPEGESKFLVIVAFSPDNASVFMDLDDVVTLAIEKDIPIYAIAVGENAESYPLKYMCAATGGRFYSISAEKLEDTEAILREITFSGKAHYTFRLNTAALNLDFCEKLKSEISVRTVAGIYNDEWKVVLKPEKYLSAYQAVAAFDLNETSINETYHEGITELVKIMVDNPVTPIYLTGFASADESANAMEISLRRAQAVRRMLVENGVPSSKIRIRGEGTAKPRYYFQSEPWQQYYNRRVEIRWLDPELLPYEILAAQTWTEDDALKQVEEWENRGCRSYFERYIVGENPAYRVKLWGYRSIEEARDAAKMLERKFKQRLMVD